MAAQLPEATRDREPTVATTRDAAHDLYAAFTTHNARGATFRDNAAGALTALGNATDPGTVTRRSPATGSSFTSRPAWNCVVDAFRVNVTDR